jgi:basic membrane lipoprotein Med (substrate-binding protein (PBP1-ABC) superfamily)
MPIVLRRLVALALFLWLTPGVRAQEGFSLKEPPKVAMIMIYQKNDGGWTQAFEEARVKLEAELGMKIPFVENVPEDEVQIRSAADKFIQRGFNVIIGTSFGYSDAFKKLSETYPDKAFLNAAGTTNGKNLQGFYARTYETQYLCGMVAAAQSKSGKLGFVAAHPFPVVNWTVSAFALGARQIKPDATVTTIFVGAWGDPVKERAATQALLDQGVEAIGQHVNTPTPLIVSGEKGALGTGHNRDMTEFSPKATLCSAAFVWDRYLAGEIKKIAAGDWKTYPYGAFMGIKDGGTDIACCNPIVPKEIVDKVMAEREAIIKGKQIFAGPLTDTAGKERVATGSALNDGDLWKLDWYVKGVIAQK